MAPAKIDYMFNLDPQLVLCECVIWLSHSVTFREIFHNTDQALSKCIVLGNFYSEWYFRSAFLDLIYGFIYLSFIEYIYNA